MNGLNWFWYLTGTGTMLFLIQAGFAMILRAERSGKNREVEVGSVFDDELLKPQKFAYGIKNGKPKREKK